MTGREFVEYLVKEHGLLEGYRMAKEYLEIWGDGEDPDFVSGMKQKMWEIDQL